MSTSYEDRIQKAREARTGNVSGKADAIVAQIFDFAEGDLSPKTKTSVLDRVAQVLDNIEIAKDTDVKVLTSGSFLALGPSSDTAAVSDDDAKILDKVKAIATTLKSTPDNMLTFVSDYFGALTGVSEKQSKARSAVAGAVIKGDIAVTDDAKIVSSDAAKIKKLEDDLSKATDAIKAKETEIDNLKKGKTGTADPAIAAYSNMLSALVVKSAGFPRKTFTEIDLSKLTDTKAKKDVDDAITKAKAK